MRKSLKSCASSWPRPRRDRAIRVVGLSFDLGGALGFSMLGCGIPLAFLGEHMTRLQEEAVGYDFTHSHGKSSCSSWSWEESLLQRHTLPRILGGIAASSSGLAAMEVVFSCKVQVPSQSGSGQGLSLPSSDISVSFFRAQAPQQCEAHWAAPPTQGRSSCKSTRPLLTLVTAGVGGWDD